jgi:hypothetical protein
MTLQGSIATLIYVLVTHANKRCKVATHNGGLWQRLYVYVQTMGERLLLLVATYRFSLLQHLYMLQGIKHAAINTTMNKFIKQYNLMRNARSSNT